MRMECTRRKSADRKPPQYRMGHLRQIMYMHRVVRDGREERAILRQSQADNVVPMRAERVRDLPRAGLQHRDLRPDGEDHGVPSILAYKRTNGPARCVYRFDVRTGGIVFLNGI